MGCHFSQARVDGGVDGDGREASELMAAAFADIAAVSDEPEPGISMLESWQVATPRGC